MTPTARSDDDQWDIHTGVGYTALVVAAWRALHTASPDPVARDEYAARFVAAAADPYLSGLLAEPAGIAAAVFPHLYGVQTRHFDEFFTAAAGAGIRQAVIVAAGLDTRALRLDWPAGTVVYELDRPAVLEFKRDVLAGLDARPVAGHVPVGCDLRRDWPAALRAAGFDAAAPAAWSLEGLLPYLTGPAQDALLTGIGALSAPGSRIAIGALGSHLDPEALDAVIEQHPQLQAFREVDFGALTYDPAQRADPADWLAAHGWTVTEVDTTVGLQTARGETPAEVERAVDRVLRSQYVTAVRREPDKVP
ncbi:class I SAM-dependent methyltransferase [Mycobacterium sp. 1274756.6]|uniref:SAM-dependent methyltransferase n=1 Tax=Mycobacterium sp. 1274756.6 TaxID=1834076 RepID=UPI0007FBE89B|nr:class I SAM-dependent methyltransferase [Mycobacterium sp. 1274756.6]OBJ69953.1 SAM-dependent methyltransferase [Mycobacterium sp. 1274756.6]